MRRALISICTFLIAAAFGVASAATGESRWNGMVPVQTLTTVPAGVTLPVYLTHGLKAGPAKAGTAVEGVTTEPVPLSRSEYLPQGARVTGVVVASKAGDRRAGLPAMLVIAFEKLSYRGKAVPIRTRVLAVANATDVSDTFASVNDGSDRGNASPANWTTRQVGGDQVFREGWEGPVENVSMQRVGYADFHGVYANAPTGATGVNALPRAVGVFSTDAEGLYGFDKGATLQSGNGLTRFTSPGNLVVRNGDAMLIEVIGEGRTSAGGE